MSPQEFFANNSLYGGTGTGNFLIDFFLRPVLRLGLRCPIALISAIVLWYSMILFVTLKSAFFEQD